jgi:hypothetical protein
MYQINLKIKYKMRTSTVTLIFILLSVYAFGQNENPYSQFGYQAPIMPEKSKSLIQDKLLIINSDTTSSIGMLALDIENRNITIYDRNGFILDVDTLKIYSTARWLSPDPAGQFASPYLGMGNNPHMSTDPDGGWSLVGSAVGALAGVGLSFALGDEKHWYLYAAGGFIAGGILGEVAHSSHGTDTQWSNAWDRFTAKFGEGKVFGPDGSRFRRFAPGEWNTISRLNIPNVSQRGKGEWCVYACGEAVERWLGGNRTKEDFARGQNNGQALDRGTQNVAQWRDFWRLNFPWPQFQGGRGSMTPGSLTRNDILSGMQHTGNDMVYSVGIDEGIRAGYQHNVLIKSVQKNPRTGQYRYELMDPNGSRFVTEKKLQSIHRRHVAIKK